MKRIFVLFCFFLPCSASLLYDPSIFPFDDEIYEQEYMQCQQQRLFVGIARASQENDLTLLPQKEDVFSVINLIDRYGVMEDLSCRSSYGHTPLTYAVVCKASKAVLSLLLKYGCCINARNMLKLDAIEEALVEEHIDALQLFLPHDVCDNRDITLLGRVLTSSRNRICVRILLDHGCNPYEPMINGCEKTPYAYVLDDCSAYRTAIERHGSLGAINKENNRQLRTIRRIFQEHTKTE